MRKLPFGGSSSDDIEFVEIVDSERRRGKWAGRKVFAAVALSALVAALAGWLMWVHLLRPLVDQRTVAVALAKLASSAPAIRSQITAVEKQPEEPRLLTMAGLFLNPDVGGAVDEGRREAARAAFRLAVRAGSAEAYLERGKAVRDGLLGPKDAEAALDDFKQALSSSESGVLAGDADALWVRAVQLSAGLGVPGDPEAGHQMALRAVERLSSWRLHDAVGAASYGTVPFNGKRPALALKLMDRQIGAKDFSSLWQTLHVCSDLHQRSDRTERHYCVQDRFRRAAELGDRRSMGEYGKLLMSERNGIDAGLSWIAQAGEGADPEHRSLFMAIRLARTAPLEQSYQALSEFASTVKLSFDTDNTAGVLSVNDRIEMLYGFWFDIHEDGLPPVEWVNLGHAVGAIADINGHSAAVRYVLQRNSAIFNPAAQMLQGYRLAEAGRAARARGKTSTQPEVRAQAFDPFAGFTPIEPAKDNSSAADRSLPRATGYLPSERQVRAGGECRFKVDNGAGGGDAVVRLYLDGKKPAVRSFLVKRGESFTADQLAPGRYSMRYRYVGDTATYEADQQFDLTQSESTGRVRASSVTVTLYTVKDGNMKMRRVADDSF